MWLGKFLSLEDDIEELRSTIEKEIFKNLARKKLTPLEFTILEAIFNSKGLSGYDLIRQLNEHFAGTFEAHSGTIYPILSKLKRNGYLESKDIKSPIGPIRKVYFLTEAGAVILKYKVNKNFIDQLNFTRNFLVELASIYIQSFPLEEKEEQIIEVQKLINDVFNDIIEKIPLTLNVKLRCHECGSEINRSALFCPICGEKLTKTNQNNE